LARRLAAGRVVEQIRVTALQLPADEERLPVDELAQFGQRVVLEHAYVLHVMRVMLVITGRSLADVLRLLQQHARTERLVAAPVDRRPVGARGGEAQELLLAVLAGVTLADGVVL